MCFSQPLHTLLHSPEHLGQPAVQGLQVLLRQHGRQRVSGEGFPHDVTQAVLGLGQKLQSEQRRALDPVRDVFYKLLSNKTVHQNNLIIKILTCNTGSGVREWTSHHGNTVQICRTQEEEEAQIRKNHHVLVNHN